MSMCLEVTLMSGKSSKIDVPVDTCLDDLRGLAQRWLHVGTGRLLTATGEVLAGTRTVSQAGILAGDVLTLQVGQEQLVDVREVQADMQHAALEVVLQRHTGVQKLVQDYAPAGRRHCLSYKAAEAVQVQLLRGVPIVSVAEASTQPVNSRLSLRCYVARVEDP
ncbi:unnamed protein product [Symbiodinium natans]|uniref:Ubiquitin-like domain-containing protein n=1 Tax=Symbiodinium natans TaxID=878477 RepID=A0A812IEZ4_9DINO|nr:unnamed protein product [Symbiodinium natans]